VEVFFDGRYCGVGHDFDTTRKAERLADDHYRRPVPGIELRSPRHADPGDFVRIHDQDYVTAVMSGTPGELAGSSGIGWDLDHVYGVLASTGGCIHAASSAWLHGISGTLSSGLHHARRDRGAGYCTINGIALAALTFLDMGAERVLIVDLDAHCGGGTADIVGADARIAAIDISTSTFDGYDPPPGWSLDIISESHDYLATVEDRLAAVPVGSVDAVVYNAGMDPHERCAIGGLDGITDNVLAAREQMVFDFAADRSLPIAFALAGGYSEFPMGPDHLTALHRLTIEAAAASALDRMERNDPRLRGHQPFRLIRADEAPVALIHVPHASPFIPETERWAIRLTNAGLGDELTAMTDWHTDQIAAAATTSRTHVFVNQLSRLVVDPERFPDDTEPMNAVGMGAIYRRTSHGHVLREDDGDAMNLMDRWFRPYAEAMAYAVNEALRASGRCLIVDLHSYPANPLPYELDQDAHRPGVCLGTDPDHTPPELVALAREVFADVLGGVAENTPFAGTYVPTMYFRTDRSVSSIMIEIRRDLYLADPHTYLPEKGGDLARRIRTLIDQWTELR
jgi:acetoin utilization deacetylase AcuC-like enzyme